VWRLLGKGKCDRQVEPCDKNHNVRGGGWVDGVEEVVINCLKKSDLKEK